MNIEIPREYRWLFFGAMFGIMSYRMLKAAHQPCKYTQGFVDGLAAASVQNQTHAAATASVQNGTEPAK